MLDSQKICSACPGYFIPYWIVPNTGIYKDDDIVSTYNPIFIVFPYRQLYARSSCRVCQRFILRLMILVPESITSISQDNYVISHCNSNGLKVLDFGKPLRSKSLFPIGVKAKFLF